MARNPRLHIRVSETNHRKVKQFSAEHGVHVGSLIDEALTLLFTPPEDRPDAAIIQRLERIEDRRAGLAVRHGAGSPAHPFRP